MKKSLAIILAFSLIGSGCNTINLVYRNADVYLQHKINAYTSFNPKQKETIRKEVSDYMMWHRKVALQEYISFLQNLNGATQYEGEISVDEAARLRKHLLDLYRKSLLPAILPTAQLLSDLDNQQIEELDNTFFEHVQKQKKEQLGGNLDENLERRAEKTIAFLEWLAGDLNKMQKQEIMKMSLSLPFVSPAYIEFREANQRRLIALLKDHPGEQQIAAFLTSWILSPETTRTSQQQSEIQSFESSSDEMVVRIHKLLTAQQKEHIKTLISTYIDEMRILSKDTSENAARAMEILAASPRSR